MNNAEITRVLSELVRRVEALESAGTRPAARAASRLDLVNSLLEETPSDLVGDGEITYAGVGQTAVGTIAYQMSRSWSELTTADPSPLAACIVALASPMRVAIIQKLTRGPAAKADLSATLDEPSAGQLYHHLKELIAAGIIHQPERAVYAIQPHRLVPLLVLLTAAFDISHLAADASTQTDEESP